MSEEKKMIPLSVIDALIEKLEIEQDLPNKTGHDQDAYQFAMKTLEEIKKEAILVQEPLEQRIKDRIKELESEKYQLGWSETFEQRRNLIDELRKLLQ